MTSPLTTFFSTLLYTTYKFYVAVVCPEIDHRRQNMVRTSVTYNYASYANFLALNEHDVICDLLRNIRTATWDLFVKQYKAQTHVI